MEICKVPVFKYFIGFLIDEENENKNKLINRINNDLNKNFSKFPIFKDKIRIWTKDIDKLDIKDLKTQPDKINNINNLSYKFLELIYPNFWTKFLITQKQKRKENKKDLYLE